ncbi:hypothetical protein QFC19_002507 [Naganishia cerealis]|uniref:Uncharacterized protein n=1 Tax=Naganishia cerealis TaxID=610337 RepID=A0ACC2WAK6_9TREE|nr:hypothetical protein QFC19_002507 [Naganishia cerealis]
MGWLSSKLRGDRNPIHAEDSDDDTDLKQAINTGQISSNAQLDSTADLPLLSGTDLQVRYEIGLAGRLSTNLVVKRLEAPATWITQYWIKISEWKKEPDFVFHDEHRAGPVIGSGVMRKRNHDMTLRIGGTGTLGDHQDGALLAKVNQDKKYRDSGYTLKIPTSSGNGSRIYHFARTQSTADGVKGFMGKLAFYNWLITNVRKETVGLYLENTKGAISLTRGAFTINPNTLDGESDTLFVMLGLVAIMERARRDLTLATTIAASA